MSALLLLRAVPAASLLAVPDALGVQRAADDLVAHARQVLHAAAAHEHHRVLLQVVADARDVGGHLDATGEADASDLAQRRVRLLRRRGVDARAHTAALRGTLQRRGLGLLDLVLAALADQLVDRGHGWPGSPTCAGSCSRCGALRIVLAVPVLLGVSPGPGRQPPSGPRGRACHPSPGPAAVDGPDSVAPRDSAPSSPASTGGTPATRRMEPPATQAHREREQAQGTLGTADHDTRAEEARANRVPQPSRA